MVKLAKACQLALCASLHSYSAFQVLVFWFLETYNPSETVQIARTSYIHKGKIKFGSGFTQYMGISILTTVSAKKKT
jgi:hypothetical protein